MKWALLVLIGCGEPYMRPPSPMATIYLGAQPFEVVAYDQGLRGATFEWPLAEIGSELVVQRLLAHAVGDKRHYAFEDELYAKCRRSRGVEVR